MMIIGETNSVSASNRQKWDLGRFWQTLSYFDVFPVLGCLQRLLTGQEKLTNTMQTDRILVIGATSIVGRQIVACLQQKNYRVRALVENENEAKDVLGESVELFTADLALPENLTPSLMADIAAIIYCVDAAIEPVSSMADTPENLGYKSMMNLLNIAQPVFKGGEKLLFDFSNPSSNLSEVWGAVDDVVMGGVSQSGFRLVGDRAIFSGKVSTANNGGFASVRTRNLIPPIDLSTYQGIALRVKGDGSRYKFIIRAEGKWDGIGYSYSFDTVKDSWITVKIPFLELIPVFRAKTVSDAGDFNRSQVYSMQLMLSKFEYDGGLNPRFSAGFFQLEIESIKAYGKRQATPQLILLDPIDINLPVNQDNNLTNYPSVVPLTDDPLNKTYNWILKTEEAVKNTGFNYTIIRTIDPANRPSDKIASLNEIKNGAIGLNQDRIAELSVNALTLSGACNKILTIEALEKIAAID